MNTLNFFLGFISVLLIGLFVFLLSSMQKSTDEEEELLLRSQIASLKAEMQQIDQLRLVNNTPTNPVATGTPTTSTLPNLPVSPPAESSELKTTEDLDLAALKKEQELLAQETPDTSQEEDPTLLPPLDPQENITLEGEPTTSEQQSDRRTKLIRNALLIARIENVSQEGYASIQVLRPENIQEKQMLALRRDSGIFGRVQITKLYSGNEGIVDPIPGSFLGGEVILQAGDELIIPPFY